MSCSGYRTDMKITDVEKVLDNSILKFSKKSQAVKIIHFE